MNSPIPVPLLLTAGNADAVREQLGLSPGEPVEAMDVAQLPLSPGLRQQLHDWAAMFVEQQRSHRRDDASMIRWGEQGVAVASALAGEWGPDVRFRYLSHSPAPGHAVAGPVAGLFEDLRQLPVIAVDRCWTAYHSTLTLEFGRAGELPTPPAKPWLTAATTDTTDDRLRELRRRAVDPVVRSLLTPDELAGARVIVYREDGMPEICLWLEAGGEEMRHWLWHPGDNRIDPIDPVAVASNLADSMEDWVCETRFAWGQRRVAR